MKAKALQLLDDIDESQSEVILTKIDEDNYQIVIKPRFEICYGCKKTYKRELVRVRQSKKVPILQVSKKFCPKCLPTIDFIINKWKGREANPGEILSI